MKRLLPAVFLLILLYGCGGSQETTGISPTVPGEADMEVPGNM